MTIQEEFYYNRAKAALYVFRLASMDDYYLNVAAAAMVEWHLCKQIN